MFLFRNLEMSLGLELHNELRKIWSVGWTKTLVISSKCV